jgi:hypothetical protein
MLFKEPTEILDYEIGWADWLGDLTIQSSSWVGPAGITIVADAFTDTATQIKLSSGTWGEIYELVNTIVAIDDASNTQTENRSILIRIQRSVAYCSSTEVRRRAQGGSGSGGSATVTALTPAELDALIEQASRMFDLECGVPEGYFNPVPIPIATARILYGDGTNYLHLPPYVAGSLDTSLTLPEGYTVPTFAEQNGYLVLTSTNGILAPFNNFHNYSSWPGWWTGVPITVSAIWGWRETPADVKAAVIEWVLNLHRETDPASIKMVGLEGQPLREAVPPRVKAVARKWRAKASTRSAFV